MEPLLKVNEIDCKDFQTLCHSLTILKMEIRRLPGVLNLRRVRWKNAIEQNGIHSLDKNQHHSLESIDINNMSSTGRWNFVEKLLEEANEYAFYEKILDWRKDAEIFFNNPTNSKYDKFLLNYRIRNFVKVLKHELITFCSPKTNPLYKKLHGSQAQCRDEAYHSRIKTKISAQKKFQLQYKALRRMIDSRLFRLQMSPEFPNLNINDVQDQTLQCFQWKLSQLFVDFISEFLNKGHVRKPSIVRQQNSRDKLLERRRGILKDDEVGYENKKSGLDDMSSLTEALQTCSEPRSKYKLYNFMLKFPIVCKEIEDYINDSSNPEQVIFLLKKEFRNCLCAIRHMLFFCSPLTIPQREFCNSGELRVENGQSSFKIGF
ncbi:hypothetical protein CDAR_390631 [Caerostris darwini]|uniref:Ycf1 n=1 Tax=Caerostris darwini TaxID=1538125 RepID=A0AAV4S106_9ARAC|nr:hypothetical protein CDAR_390631 [Caerostris darwini]